MLPFGHDFVELLDDVGPMLGIEAGEGLVVVRELLLRLSLEARQVAAVPIDEVSGELADGVVALALRPAGLFRSESFYRDVGGHEPLFTVVRGTQLLEQNAPQRWRRLSRLILCEHRER